MQAVEFQLIKYQIMKKKELNKGKKIEDIINNLTNDNLNQIRGGKLSIGGTVKIAIDF
jgi:hypothetical protein